MAKYPSRIAATSRLIDTSGTVAGELLSCWHSPDGKGVADNLVRAIAAADALVLAVDASAGPSRREAEFALFERFLRLLERGRGRRTDVGDLPVYLVLTKCDLLAQPDSTSSVWMDRVDKRKQQASRHFQDFLNRQRGTAPMPFGTVNLHLHTTAAALPELTGQEPGRRSRMALPSFSDIVLLALVPTANDETGLSGACS